MAATSSSDGEEIEELPVEHARALTEAMTALPDAPGMFEVSSASGSTYTVDVRQGSCTCPDARYRDRTCKHLLRVEYELGRRGLPDWAQESRVDALFQAFVTPEDDDRREGEE
jgi:hypothetical protein